MIVTTFGCKELIYAAITLLTIIQSSYGNNNIVLMSNDDYTLNYFQIKVINNLPSEEYNDIDKQQYIKYLLINKFPQDVIEDNMTSEMYIEYMTKFDSFFSYDTTISMELNNYGYRIQNYSQILDGYEYADIVNQIYQAPRFDWGLLPNNNFIEFNQYISLVYGRLMDGIENIRMNHLIRTDIINDIDGYVRNLRKRLDKIYLCLDRNTNWYTNSFLSSNPIKKEPIESYALRNMAKGLLPVGRNYFYKIYSNHNKDDGFDYYHMEKMPDALFIMALIINYHVPEHLLTLHRIETVIPWKKRK